jgi:hypothetical protein
MSWSEDEQEVHIHIDVSEEQIHVFNNDAELRSRLSELLKRYYRYEGKSRFDIVDDMPF